MSRPLQVTDFRCLHHLRVRWAEVDVQHIVFNAHYLTYFDVAMTDYWRALALPYAGTMQQLGGDLYLKKASVEYHASAEMDDQLQIGIRCQRIGNSSLLFTGAIFRAEQLLVTGELVYVYADPATQTSRPVPDVLRQTILGFEAGEPVVSLHLGRWADVGEAAAPVRTQVFVQEQAIPADMEWDEQDATALHAVLHNRLGLPVATGRLLQAEPGVAKVGRMAVLKPLRGFDLGRQVLQALMQAARERGDTQLILSAQRSAIGFYARQGYQPHGDFYDDVGIPHQDMVIRL